jgi:hypothetical protein
MIELIVLLRLTKIDNRVTVLIRTFRIIMFRVFSAFSLFISRGLYNCGEKRAFIEAYSNIGERTLNSTETKMSVM